MLKQYNQEVVYDIKHTVTAWVNMIGIRVKKDALGFSNKSNLVSLNPESIFEREETFEYDSHRLSRSEKLRVANICEKYTMKSTLLSEEDSALV